MIGELVDKFLNLVNRHYLRIKNSDSEGTYKETTNVALSQPEYFNYLLGSLAKTKRSLEIIGYVPEIMESPEIQEQLSDAAKGIGYFRSGEPVQISVVVPIKSQNGNYDFLENLAEQYPSVSLLKVDGSVLRDMKILTDDSLISSLKPYVFNCISQERDNLLE